MQRGKILQRMWDGRVDSWHAHVTDSPAFAKVRDAVLEAAAAKPDDDVVDLGAGNGFLTLPLARTARRVVAVDLSRPMLDDLEARAISERQKNIDRVVADLASLRLPDDSADLVVSNYALHHLPHAQKRALLVQAGRWLRPGGRIVIADMMFGRGVSSRDRRIFVQKAARLLRKGPGGVWRLAKNMTRFGLGVGSERPATPEFWCSELRDAGFADVHYTPVVEEAGMVTAVIPEVAAAERLGRPGGVHARG